jgi:hypothetical protein
MGAPGEIILCENGHQVYFINSRLDLASYDLDEERRDKIINSPCDICGAPVKYRFAHYDGNINDCSDVKILDIKSVKVMREVEVPQYILDPTTVEDYIIIKHSPHTFEAGEAATEAK